LEEFSLHSVFGWWCCKVEKESPASQLSTVFWIYLLLLQVAREAVLKFRPGVDIVAHHGNVKNTEFDIDFFKQFSVVLNGLDNLEARRHVNRLCLAAGVPLVESGTTGYLGQVHMHVHTNM
jgi:hypothetical protein